MPSPVVLTGASGFVGAAVAARLRGHQSLPMGQAAWREALRATDFRGRTVVHLAGRAHDTSASASQLDEDNVEKTAQLARAAAEGGCGRFVFLSTIKVHGEESLAGPLRESSPAAPQGAYARSKWLAEEAVREVATRAGMPWVVIRAPLVYGRHARGNFGALVRLADTPLWLPFAGIDNRRSLVHVDDLAMALILAVAKPEAMGRAFFAAHPTAVSTAQLVAGIRAAIGRPARLFAVRPASIERLADMIGRERWLRPLTRSLEADPTELQRELGWSPRYGLASGLREALE